MPATGLANPGVIVEISASPAKRSRTGMPATRKSRTISPVRADAARNPSCNWSKKRACSCSVARCAKAHLRGWVMLVAATSWRKTKAVGASHHWKNCRGPPLSDSPWRWANCRIPSACGRDRGRIARNVRSLFATRYSLSQLGKYVRAISMTARVSAICWPVAASRAPSDPLVSRKKASG